MDMFHKDQIQLKIQQLTYQLLLKQTKVQVTLLLAVVLAAADSMAVIQDLHTAVAAVLVILMLLMKKHIC